ncbi:MAG TPA: hemin uptake protein HemP [Burkholderiales bacterium]|jgi:hemin uptake protein HemP|nr:hemin uptake protein HemP [Burkholderiales bacterium]
MSSTGHAETGEGLVGSAAQGEQAASPAGAARRVTSTRELLGGRNEVQIEHNGEIYTLRQTSKGKLILTK